MAAVITATVDQTYRRVQVQLTGWTVDGTIVVTGTSGDDSWPVRGLTDVLGGATLGYDYEAPLDSPVTYTASSGATLVTSNTVTVGVTTARLVAPSLPGLNVDVEIISTAAVTRQRPRAVLHPIGRRTAIAITGDLSAGSFMLGIRTRTDDDAAALESLLAASSTVLVQWPGTRRDHTYVDTGDVEESPVVGFRHTVPGDVGDWAEWSVECDIVDRPEGGLYGDPTASWGAIVAAYATWGALMADKASWLRVLEGVS